MVMRSVVGLTATTRLRNRVSTRRFSCRRAGPWVYRLFANGFPLFEKWSAGEGERIPIDRVVSVS